VTKSGGRSKATKRYISDRTQKILFGLSGNECAYPGCSEAVIRNAPSDKEPVVLGIMAHIYAAADNGPRGDPNMSTAERNSAGNLIVFCPTHHDLIDKQPDVYPADLLLEWKKKHESRFTKSLVKFVDAVGFAELEVTANAVAASDGPTGAAIDIPIPPADKIARNNLNKSSEMQLQIGAAKSAEVAKVVASIAQLDTGFPNRLKAGFVNQYRALVGEGFSGDELFKAMGFWAARGSTEPIDQMSGLCVLTHLFLICEVFERE